MPVLKVKYMSTACALRHKHGCGSRGGQTPAPSATALDCHGPESALQAVEPTELLGSVDLNARRFVRFMILLLTAAGLVIPAAPAQAQPELTIQPLTWNVVGLDSNDANAGPNNFPVGARASHSLAGHLLGIDVGHPLQIVSQQMLHVGDFST